MKPGKPYMYLKFDTIDEAKEFLNAPNKATKLVWVDSVPHGIKVSKRIKIKNEKQDTRLRKEGGTN